MASERDKKQRLEDNKRVRDGTIRKGKGGKGLRRWNKSTARWEKVSVKGAAKKYGSVSRPEIDRATYKPGSGTTRPRDKNLGLGGRTKGYVSPTKRKDVSPSSRSTKTSRAERIGIRGPHRFAADVGKAAARPVGKAWSKYGPFSEWAGGSKPKGPKVGDTRTRLVRASDGNTKRITLRWDGKKWTRKRGS